MNPKVLVAALVLINLFIIGGCSSSGYSGNSYNYSEQSSFGSVNLDTVKAGRFDTGKMWTFDHPPVDYFKEEYNFTLTPQWLTKARLAALRFATYCSASFISEDGLIMTNNHCARESAVQVSKPGEDIQSNGFFAETLQDERPVEGLFVDQLVLIKDVTEEVLSTIDRGNSEEEKLANEKEIIAEIEKREEKETGLSVSVTPLYNGGKYSLYGYKRYNDVRLVFTPEHLLGHFGGEYDNFTYPRYNLDCAFFRVYSEGRPLKTENYFKWSPNGAVPGEAVFVVGNPGSTSRLLTVSQLEYLRDITYPATLKMYTSLVDFYNDMIEQRADSSNELYVQLLKYLNAQKVFKGMIEGLNDPVLMQRKKDFEITLRSKIDADPGLKSLYSNIWDEIAEIQDEQRLLNSKIEVLNIDPETSSSYFFVARDVVDLADELSLPERDRQDQYLGSELDSTISAIIPEYYSEDVERPLLKEQLTRLINFIGEDDPFVKKVTGGRTGDAAVDYVLANSVVDNPDQLKELVKKGSDAILNSSDLFIYFVLHSLPMMEKIDQASMKLSDKDELYSQSLGKAIYEVYGTSVPPDATFTLRISDGVIEGYPYNGTIAPPVTTYYGMYDRYYSFKKKEPWNLPEKWQHPSPDFDLSVPFNFVSTNDITGGSSSSPVINKDAEIVGVAFDGNIESLPGSFIFRTEQNRTVSTHSAGIVEALSDIYHATRLVDELTHGKIIKKETAGTR